MQAIIYTKYGSPESLQLVEVAVPTPKAQEVLIKMQASSVNPYDWHHLRGRRFWYGW